MLGATVSQRKIFWTLQIGGWLVLIPPFIAMSLLAGASPGLAVVNGVTRQVTGFLLTLGLTLIYRRWNWATFSLWRHGAVAMALCAVAMLADLAVIEWTRHTLQLSFGTIPPRSLQLATSVGRICIYGSWSALFLAMRFFFDLRDRDLRLAQAEIDAREAELHVLRAQLNPHFLFNALNSILAEADDNPSRVKAITLNLSELLRFSLRQQDHFGQLGAEIAAIENYLKVESSRFEERLDWHLDVSAEAREAVVPSALLLPLVENAIKYGLQTSPTHLRLTVKAERRESMLVASVENSGHWIKPDPSGKRSTGIGLANLRRRLALLCGPTARLDISHPAGAVRITLEVPAVTALP